MRLFLALCPDQNTLDTLCAIPLPEGRRTPRENLHMTLAFLGETAPERVPLLETLLRKSAKGIPAIEIHMDRLNCFSDKRDTRLVYLTGEPPKELTLLASRLHEALRREGFPLEDRAFLPHVTLCRRCASTPTASPNFSCNFPTLSLMESELRPEGAMYRAIYTVALT